MYGTVLNGAAQPINTAAAGTAALMSPAINAYNASIGLNNAGWNGVNTYNELQLQAAKQNQNSGGFLGGLLGGLGSGIGGGISGLLFPS